MELLIGTTVRNTQEERDDDDGTERITPPGTLGQVTSIDDHPTQGRTFGVVFETGGWVFYLASEVDACLTIDEV